MQNNTSTLKLFIDGSVHPQSNIGYGAYIFVDETTISLDILKTKVKVKRFEETSSTKLELQTLLWALDDIHMPLQKVIIFTDCQNIIGLQARREGFEKNDYHTKSNKRIKNYALYQAFYKMIDKLDCEFTKIRGHKVSHQKDTLDKIFTLVNRASRDALRKGM